MRQMMECLSELYIEEYEEILLGHIIAMDAHGVHIKTSHDRREERRFYPWHVIEMIKYEMDDE